MRPHRTVLRAGVLALLILVLNGCALLDAILIQIGLERGIVESRVGPNASLVLRPGQCTPFTNPVPPDASIPHTWESGDAFDLHGPPPWLSVSTSRGAGTPTRRLCVTADAPAVTRVVVPYSYVRSTTIGEAGLALYTGQLFISTVLGGFTVNPTATPSTIVDGDDTTLRANISEGVPPFVIAWTPRVRVVNETLDTTEADPRETTTFTVTVSDATGTTVSGTVTVTVLHPPRVSIGASPPRNGGWEPGTVVHLSTSVADGVPPFTYAWTPATGLDDATRPDPTFTTPAAGVPGVDYVVTVTDANGQQGSSFINVRGIAPLTVSPAATPDTIGPGQSTQLRANATADCCTLIYQWSGPGLSATDIEDPVATPPGTTTYTVTVTDIRGRVETASVTVTVVGPDLAVTLVDSVDPVGQNRLLIYTATVTNVGTLPATGVMFVETLPLRIETSGGAASQGTCSTTFPTGTIRVACDLGTIAPGASATVTLSGFTFGIGPVTNTATVTLNEVDVDPANNTATQTTTFLPGF
jgi:hypothetical protein